jgi:hypothetical protein
LSEKIAAETAALASCQDEEAKRKLGAELEEHIKQKTLLVDRQME